MTAASNNARIPMRPQYRSPARLRAQGSGRKTSNTKSRPPPRGPAPDLLNAANPTWGCGSRPSQAWSWSPLSPRWSSCHHSQWRPTACSPTQSPTQTQALFSQLNHPFRKPNKRNPERPATSRFCPMEPPPLTVTSAKSIPGRTCHAAGAPHQMSCPHYFDFVDAVAGAAVAGTLDVFEVLSVLCVDWVDIAPPVLPVISVFEYVFPAPVYVETVPLVVDFLLQPTVPAPITNAKQRTNNPRSLCTLFPSFPRDPRLVDKTACQPPQPASQ
jgi:hypothetical protein